MNDSNEITIKDFQNWLDGVVEFQDEDWTPNPEQWEKILDKIGKLVDSEPKQQESFRRGAPQQISRLNQPHQQMPHRPPMQQEPLPEVESYEPTGLSPEEEYLRQQEQEAIDSEPSDYVSDFK